MWAGGDCRATRSLRLGSASALRLIWRGAAVSMESTLGCLDAGCSKQRSFCCLLPALALGPSFACRFSWPFIYIHLSGRLLALPRSLPRSLPCLTSFHVASQGPQLASLSGHDAEQCEAARIGEEGSGEREAGGRRGCCLLISPFHRFRVVPFELQFVCGLCSEAQAQAQAISIRYMRCGEYQWGGRVCKD